MRSAYPASTLPLLILLTFSPAARPCTTFFLKAGDVRVFGWNFDWMVPDALIIVNKRHVGKSALTIGPSAHWVSRFGSVTVNQHGREFPLGGMNEVGLVVAQMWLSGTTYPQPDERESISTLQWIQYQLDTAESVAQVLASLERLRVASISGAPLHYFIADATGDCAAIEFIDGAAVCHRGDQLPVSVLTNNTYQDSLAALQRCAGFGGDAPIGESMGSLDRFARAADRLRGFHLKTSGDPVRYAFKVLRDVAQGKETRWSVVYDLGGRRLHVRSPIAPSVRAIELGRLDFDCQSVVGVLDVHAPLSGDVTQRFELYTRARNEQLVLASLEKTDFLKDFPDELARLCAAYPDTTVCAPPPTTAPFHP